MNIYEKLSEISNRLSAVAKKFEVGFGDKKYKAVAETDVLAVVKPLEHEFRVYSYPISRKVIESGQITSSKGNIQIFERIETTYRFVNIDDPKEYIDIISYGDGIDAQDKSVGKAMTYADKYALLKAYKIVTGDDPDTNMSEPQKAKSTSTAIAWKLLEEARTLNIELEKIAKYLGKTVEELTNEDLKKCIEQKKSKLGK